MPDINLTLGTRLFRQSTQDRASYVNVNGTALDDRIEIYNGNIFAAGGNDYVARIDTSNGSVSVNFWNAERGIRVNLAEGWAEDGLGGRDTLVGIASITGSQFDDYFWGDANDNYYYGQGGHDVIEGGAGTDGIGVAGFLDETGKFRMALLSELVIQVSADGRSATVMDPTGTGRYFRYDLHDVEYVSGDNGQNEFIQLELSSLIKPATVALTTIAAGPAYRWNLQQALGTSVNLTYSFMADADASSGKRSMSNAEKSVVREALLLVSSFTGLNFEEVQESTQNYGQIRWAVNQQSNSKGYTWLPEVSNLSGQAGDIFMDEESMLYLQLGTQGYEAIIHELGHALGLRHPVNADTNDHWTEVAAERFNSTQLTVMSQPATPESLSRIDFGILDVAALRYLYGAKPVNTSSSIYQLSDHDGQYLKTIIDDSGIDTVDCSSLSTGVSINLMSGMTWDVGLTRDGKQATNNIASSYETVIEAVIGSAHDDVLIGNSQNNQITPGLGNDWVDGLSGLDTVYIQGLKNSYILNPTNLGLELRSNNLNSGLKTLVQIERLVFTDTAVAWDLDAGAGQVAKILGAVFGKTSLSNKNYVGIGLSFLDSGWTYDNLAALALEAAGAKTNDQIVSLLWKNVIGTTATTNDKAPYIAMLENGVTPGALAHMAADTTFNTANINLTGLALTGIEYTQ